MLHRCLVIVESHHRKSVWTRTAQYLLLGRFHPRLQYVSFRFYVFLYRRSTRTWFSAARIRFEEASTGKTFRKISNESNFCFFAINVDTICFYFLLNLRIDEFEMQSGINLVFFVAEFRWIVSGVLVQVTKLVNHPLATAVERSSQTREQISSKILRGMPLQTIVVFCYLCFCDIKFYFFKISKNSTSLY